MEFLILDVQWALDYADAAPLSRPRYTVCTMVLYIPLGDGRWETYSLSGGP